MKLINCIAIVGLVSSVPAVYRLVGPEKPIIGATQPIVTVPDIIVANSGSVQAMGNTPAAPSCVNEDGFPFIDSRAIYSLQNGLYATKFPYPENMSPINVGTTVPINVKFQCDFGLVFGKGFYGDTLSRLYKPTVFYVGKALVDDVRFTLSQSIVNYGDNQSIKISVDKLSPDYGKGKFWVVTAPVAAGNSWSMDNVVEFKDLPVTGNSISATITESDWNAYCGTNPQYFIVLGTLEKKDSQDPSKTVIVNIRPKVFCVNQDVRNPVYPNRFDTDK